MASKEESERAPRPSRQAKRSIAEASQAEDSEEEFSDGEEVELGDGLFETGQIIKVSVQEFMCHRKFTGETLVSLSPARFHLDLVDFGRHVNFITGQNGSGKSAIVAALQLCLGTNATKTGRGTNMASLIREGSEGPAILQVTLLNEGSDAYQPDRYGNRIIIERKIPRSGGSSYRLLNKDMSLVSNKKEDLEKILQVFNIFADNPCCILTQEESKKFIQGHAHEKFEFFMKASGLHLVNEEITAIEDQIELAKKSTRGHEEKLKEKKTLITKMREDYKQLMSLDKYAEEIQLNLAKIHWRDVYEADIVLADAMRVVTDREDDLNNAIEALNKARQELLEVQDVEAVSAQLAELERSLLDVTSESEKKTSLLSQKKKSLNHIENQRKTVSQSINENLRECDDLDKKVRS